MDELQSQIHDIIPPPAIPFSPGALTWLSLLAAIIILCLWLIRIVRRESNRRTSLGLTAANTIQNMLNYYSRNQNLSNKELDKLLLTLKRFISLREDTDATSMTLKEIISFARKKEQPYLLELAHQLSMIESQRFQASKNANSQDFLPLIQAFDAYSSGAGKS